MTFADQPVNEFVSNIAAGRPTPGGGSTAAVAGATGAALVEMVCNLTIGQDGYEEVEDDLEDIREELQSHQERLLELADEDSEAFEAVMEAYQQSGDNRDTAIEAASKQATEVPLETAEMCLAIIEYAVEVTEIGNQNALTDGGTGGLLAHAALKAALYNVAINLGSIEDDDFVSEKAERVDEIEAQGEEALSTVTENVDSGL